MLVAVVLADIVLRSLFSLSRPWLSELSWHLFIAISLFGAASTLARDGHVRVDVVSSRLSPRFRLWVDLLMSALVAMPFLCVLTWKSYDFFAVSYRIGEASAVSGGIGALWVIKGAIPVALCFLVVQVIARMAECLHQLMHGHD